MRHGKNIRHGEAGRLPQGACRRDRQPAGAERADAQGSAGAHHPEGTRGGALSGASGQKIFRRTGRLHHLGARLRKRVGRSRFGLGRAAHHRQHEPGRSRARHDPRRLRPHRGQQHRPRLGLAGQRGKGNRPVLRLIGGYGGNAAAFGLPRIFCACTPLSMRARPRSHTVWYARPKAAPYGRRREEHGGIERAGKEAGRPEHLRAQKRRLGRLRQAGRHSRQPAGAGTTARQEGAGESHSAARAVRSAGDRHFAV